MQLNLQILGGFRLSSDGGHSVQLPTRKAEALLGYLALPLGQPHRRDRLAALLWGDRGDRQARHSLNQTVFSIRKAIASAGQDPIIAQGETLALDPTAIAVDADRFEALAKTRDPAAAVEMAELYRGDLLEGVNLREDDFDDWLIAERVRLREVALTALATLLQAQQATGQTDAAVQTALQILALDPLAEAVHRALMQLYVEQNRDGTALRQYELCRTALRRELNVAPGAETEALFRQIAERRARSPEPKDEAPVPGDEPGNGALSPDDLDLADFAGSERKYLTVLCVEVVPQQDADDDPEADLEVLGPAFEMVERIAGRYGGTVTNRQSHTVTALFGAPTSYEDYAVRACYAALEMQESAARAFNGRLRLRIGMSSGVVVIRRFAEGGTARYEAVGHTINFANQVHQAVAPGSTAVSDETRRLTDAFVETEPFGSVAHAATGHSTDIYLLLRRKPIVRPWQARLSRGLSKFVGREAETAELAKALEHAGLGEGQMIAVVGEPGVGKSRLVHEFIESSWTNGWKLLEAGASALESATTYGVARQLLRSWLGITARDSQADIAERAQRMVLQLDPSLAPALPVVLSLMDLPVDDEEWTGLTPSRRQRRILGSIKALLGRLSEQQPLLVVLEDLHWIDGETQTVLDTLMDGLSDLRALLLVTHRPEYRHSWLGRSGFSFLRLNPLAADCAEQLAQTLLGDDPGVAKVAPLLVERTEGTPLFLEETVRALAETGVLVGTVGDYHLGGPVEQIEIPTSVQAVLAARIDRLPSKSKSLLQAAAVIGAEVEDALLQPISHLPEEDYFAAIATLQSAEFLYEGRQLPDVAYMFKHALTYDVAYDSLLREQRRSLHVAVVRAIENVHRDRLDEQVERLAFHAASGELVDEAIDYLYRAALRAIRHSAHEQAIGHISEGLALLEPLPETPENLRKELDFRKAMGVTMMAARGWGATEVSAAYTRAREICEKLGDDHELFTALRGQGQFHMIRGEVHTARELGERCIALAERSDDSGVQIETHHLFWSNGFFMGDVEDTAHHVNAGIASYDKATHHHLTYVYSGHDPGVCCRAFSGLVLWQQGFPARALARCEEALALAEAVSHPLTLALAYWALSYLYLFQQEPKPAKSWAEREISICDEYVMPLLLSQGLFQRGWAIAEQGDLAGGIADMEEGVARIRETGSEMGLPYFIALLGEAYAMAGNREAGLRQIDDAITTAQQTGAYFGYSEMLRLRGELLASGDPPAPDDAAACFASAIDAARRQKAPMFELRAAVSMAKLHATQGRKDQIRPLLAPLYARFGEGFDTPDLRDAKALLDARA